MKCTYCNQEHPDEAKYCPENGKPLQQICPKCANEVGVNVRFCPYCGIDLINKLDYKKAMKKSIGQKKKRTALVPIMVMFSFLGIVLIGLGILYFTDNFPGEILRLDNKHQSSVYVDATIDINQFLETKSPELLENGMPEVTEEASPTEVINSSRVEQEVSPTNNIQINKITKQALSLEDMIEIPAGEFKMGCHKDHNDIYNCYAFELPLHSVWLETYFIDKYEVTNLQYSLCVENGSCEKPSKNSSKLRDSYFGNPEFDNYPVINVSWFDAYNYCSWMEKRLPTEAEWEKAAHGINPLTFPWGDESSSCKLSNHQLRINAHYNYCVGDTTEVGFHPDGASPYGVMDMAGNVWEWVNDWYSTDYYINSPGRNPSGPENGSTKVMRGGSWSNYANYLRTSYRNEGPPGIPDGYTIGFRCAVTP